MTADGVLAGPLTAPTAAPHDRDATPERGATLELIATLCRALEDADVAYCHWKSNESLDRSATGENDLDLLVRRADSERFERVLARLDFKQTLLPPWKDLPGVSHRYALDEASGSLVHIHAHYQLVVGDDMTKNVHLPIEDAYLASASPAAHPFPIPSPEFELGVFLVRMVLKHCPWDAIIMLQGSLAASERRELAQLTGEVRLDDVWALMHRHLPVVDRALWERCLRSVRPGASAWFRVRTAARLHRALAPCARRPQIADTSLKIARRFRTAIRRKILRRGPIVTRLAAGGSLVAIVGGDGAGKSTAVDDLSTWLGKEILTTTVHLGKPPRSLLSRAVRGAMGLAASIRRSPTSSKEALRASLDGSSDMTIRSRARLVWEVCTARDRYRAYRRARRAASDGAIVVCDRFPLEEIRTMDGAVTAADPATATRGRLVEALAARERRYYERIARPDLLVVLRADPDVAMERRRGGPGESLVRPRSEEIWGIDWGAAATTTPAIVIDAGASMAEVRARIRSAVWSSL
jgi:thymidylate kinase